MLFILSAGIIESMASSRQKTLLVSFLVLLSVLLLGVAGIVAGGRLSAEMVPAVIPHEEGKPASEFPFDVVRVEVDCAVLLRKNLMVALAFGQSNAANTVLGNYMPQKDVYNFHDGKCYKAANPMLGAYDRMGSVWTGLGDAIISEMPYDAVLFVTIAQGGTSISSWAGGEPNNRRLLDAIKSLKADGFRFTHLLWHQGEADARIRRTGKRYKELFYEMLAQIRGAGVDAPVLVSVATYCRGHESDEIRQAQRELVAPALGILPGPDTDTLRGDYRYDGCHFNARGERAVRKLWLDALKKARDVR